MAQSPAVVGTDDNSTSPLHLVCRRCRLDQPLLPVGMDSRALAALNALRPECRVLQPGDPLFESDSPVQGLFVVLSGALKVVATSHDHERRIIGFHFPGEIAGIESIGEPRYQFHASAVDGTTSVARVPTSGLDAVITTPPLHKRLLRLVGAETCHRTALIMVRHQRASVRLATFLRRAAAAQRRLDISEQDITLPMSRGELADYLGLALETASRLLARFQHKRLLHVRGRTLTILDQAGISRLAVDLGG